MLKSLEKRVERLEYRVNVLSKSFKTIYHRTYANSVRRKNRQYEVAWRAKRQWLKFYNKHKDELIRLGIVAGHLKRGRILMLLTESEYGKLKYILRSDGRISGGRDNSRGRACKIFPNCPDTCADRGRQGSKCMLQKSKWTLLES